MIDYWKDHYESSSRLFDDSLLKQVGKTVCGEEIDDAQMELIVGGIVQALRLNEQDVVVDLCCGNGLIARRLSHFVAKVIGVDFAHGLIEAANKHNSAPNIEYIHSDVLRLDRKHLAGHRKVVMYEGLQYFSVEQLDSLLVRLGDLEPDSLIFIGGVPDKLRLNAYYDTAAKFAFYMRRENEGKPHMGRWWLREEIERAAALRGFGVTFLPQAPTLYTAYYRFDVLIGMQA